MTRQVRIRNGLDIPISGAPDQSVVHPGPTVRRVALNGLDYPGLKPRLLVTPGSKVELGQALFVDKRDPVVQYNSPGKGTVVDVHRGARRVLQSVVVELDQPESPAEPVFEALSEDRLRGCEREHITGRLHQSGLWTAFRTRPFSQVPVHDSVPRSIFVTAIDTRPLAADPSVIVRGHEDAFVAGLRAVSRLTEGPVYLCTGPGWNIPFNGVERVQQVEFSGPHPAGLAGTHIHHLDPVAADRTVWTVDHQDVTAIGRLFADGTIDTGRVISLAGDCVLKPRLISTRLGASADELTREQVDRPQTCRVISGSVLTGRHAIGGNAYLGRYHTQLSVIRENGDERALGWFGLFRNQYTASWTWLRKTGHRRTHAFDTAQHGRFSGMVPTRAFDKIVPLDILPSPLFRALLVGDTDQSQALGCLELDEEDVALCSFVCPAKQDYGAALRDNLTRIEKEG